MASIAEYHEMTHRNAQRGITAPNNNSNSNNNAPATAVTPSTTTPNLTQSQATKQVSFPSSLLANEIEIGLQHLS